MTNWYYLWYSKTRILVNNFQSEREQARMRVKIGNKKTLPVGSDLELRLVRILYFSEREKDGLLTQIRRKLQEEAKILPPSQEDIKSMKLVDQEHFKNLFQ